MFRCALVAASILALALPASAQTEPAPAPAAEAAPAAPAPQAWDQAKVTELGKQLEAATSDLWTTFRRQPRPTVGQGQANSFFRLQQQIRQLRSESRALSRSLQGGAGHDETLPSFESMMQTVRIAQDNARRVFTGVEVREKADATRAILNQMIPFYQADPRLLQPVGR